ncbi:MAG: BLUF domain-containing protein [Burkholderiaceae bacterium]|nr:BLUF domain-containing protein [Burkholderiaceae bacterium]
MLVRLMYVSRAADSVNQNELVAILKKSKANNVNVGVTGVLCFSAGIFLQVLEGGRSAVSSLYNKIANDPRHHDVVLLSYEEVNERNFAGWSMGRANLARLNPSLVMKYSETALLNPYAVSGKMSMALFNEMVASAAIICDS